VWYNKNVVNRYIISRPGDKGGRGIEMDQMVFGFGGLVDMTPCLFREKGQHPYFVDGILAVETVEEFDYLRWNDDILPDGGVVGHRQGGGMTKLVAVTPEQINALRAENNRRKVLAEAKAKEESEELEKFEHSLVNSGICPKCGTWCYGDCEAN